MTDDTKKPRKRKPKETLVEKRLKEGALVMRSPEIGSAWVFMDTGKAARADVCERLVERGLLKPREDGLFPGFSQTWGLA